MLAVLKYVQVSFHKISCGLWVFFEIISEILKRRCHTTAQVSCIEIGGFSSGCRLQLGLELEPSFVGQEDSPN